MLNNDRQRVIIAVQDVPVNSGENDVHSNESPSLLIHSLQKRIQQNCIFSI